MNLGDRTARGNTIEGVPSAPGHDVAPLADLKNIENIRWLNLRDTQVSDLTPLAEADNLPWLCLENTQVSDIAPLAELDNLQWLWLGGARVSDEQVQALQQALPNCNIRLKFK